VATSKDNLSKDAQELEEYFQRRDARTAPGWTPTPGTTDRATVIGLAMRTDGGYDPYPMITYRRKDGSTFTVHAFHKVLRDRLAELQTDIGKEQYISYIGPRPHNTIKNEDGTPKNYNMYDAENVGEVVEATSGKEEGFHF
jgi:hypothetical protein